MPPTTDPNANSVTIGVGVGAIARYNGSADYYLTPIGGARGELGGISFSIIGLSAFTDFIPADRVVHRIIKKRLAPFEQQCVGLLSEKGRAALKRIDLSKL